ncbi:MAG: hypothetical protein JWP47_2314 [Polaromonas sp.]|jgi:phosphoglycerate-specific signal transduction histidine kinase|nr:hypothetical protein [Polaromonas sp.]
MNEAVKEKVEHSAAELVVINAVLKQEVPPEVQTGDVAQALEKTDLLEIKINEAAQELEEVNKVLAEEVEQRRSLERELAEVKTALVEASEAAG